MNMTFLLWKMLEIMYCKKVNYVEFGNSIYNIWYFNKYIFEESI